MRIPGFPFLFRVAEELRDPRERERVGGSGLDAASRLLLLLERCTIYPFRSILEMSQRSAHSFSKFMFKLKSRKRKDKCEILIMIVGLVALTRPSFSASVHQHSLFANRIT